MLLHYLLFAFLVVVHAVGTSIIPIFTDDCLYGKQPRNDSKSKSILPKCRFSVVKVNHIPVVGCPAPGILRFSGDYDVVNINCSAPYPLDFKYGGTKPSEAIHVNFWRSVKDKSHGQILSYHADVTVYSITALHQFYTKSNSSWEIGDLNRFRYSRTGDYAFSGFHDNSGLKVSFYVFFEESLVDPTFILNRQTWKLFTNNDGRLTIPCRPTHFNSVVSLTQETNRTVQFVYSVTDGFTSAYPVSNISGIYRCTLHDGQNEATVEYKTAAEPNLFGFDGRPKASNVDIQYNVTALPNGHFETITRCRHSCVGCSKDETAVLASISVTNPAMDHMLHDFVLPLFRTRSYTVRIDHTQKDINYEIRFENGILDYVAATFCGNHQRARIAKFGKTLTGMVYPFGFIQEWSDVERDTADTRFYINLWHNRPEQDLFENEEVDFQCRFQTFVIAPPSIWYFEYYNGTITEELVDLHWVDGVSHMKRKLPLGLKKVYCVGSIWHKTIWRNVSIPIHVQPSMKPYFMYKGAPVKRFVTSGTFQYLKCSAGGGPRPTISWERDGQNITSIVPNTEYSLLHFQEVNASIQGIYYCVACNVVGCNRKKYTVEVYSDTHSETQNIALLTFEITIVVSVLTVVIMRFTSDWRGRNHVMNSKELGKFFNGKSNSGDFQGSDYAYCQPYPRQEYEISKNRFKVDKSRELGCGEFGVVYPGKVDGEIVAVKTLKSGASQPYLQFLMTELKIMINLKHHDNVVELCGAYTQELYKGKLYVFLKYCALGNMETYLRDNRGWFMSNKQKYAKLSEANNVIRYEDLFKWSIEIAKGMEHLSSKKIIHADLAARNILLTKDRTAKVTDFGLSRRQYTYIEKKFDDDGPLPWKWMALESFQDKSYTEKTDVWAFGVTLWEIFSLGKVPYPNHSHLNFVTLLEKGFRLSQPTFASDKLYHTVMKRCWKRNPADRPNFTKLVEMLKSLPKSSDRECKRRVRKDSGESLYDNVHCM